jgi:hypothetical protein
VAAAARHHPPTRHFTRMAADPGTQTHRCLERTYMEAFYETKTETRHLFQDHNRTKRHHAKSNTLL